MILHMMTGISARLRGNGVEVTAQFPEDEEISHRIESKDLREMYQMNPAKFLDKYGDNEQVLTDLFTYLNESKC